MSTKIEQPIAAQRREAIEETVATIRDIETEQGVTRESLERIKSVLAGLAARPDLFPEEDFPIPDEGDRRGQLYRLSEDEDHRFALYANSALTGIDSPVHNHTTWAVIVGVRGEEENRFYERTDDGVRQIGGDVVAAGTGVALMPDDLHSIHIHGDRRVLNFHMYGLALEQLHERQYYRPRDGQWATFPAASSIVDAR